MKRLALAFICIILCFSLCSCSFLLPDFNIFEDLGQLIEDMIGEDVFLDGNSVQSGNADVSFEIRNPKTLEWSAVTEDTHPFPRDHWEPGMYRTADLRVTNNGQSSVTWSIALSGDYGKLAEVLDVYVVRNSDPGQDISDKLYPEYSTINNVTYLGKLSEVRYTNMQNSMTANTLAPKGENPEASSSNITIVIKMPESASNEYQGVALEDDVTLQLVVYFMASTGGNFNVDEFEGDITIQYGHGE